MVEHATRLFPEGGEAGAAELPESLEVRIEVRDRELIEEFVRLRPGRERDAFTADALRIGVLALRQVRGQVDAQTVRHEVDRLLDELRQGLSEHQSTLGERLSSTLREYFDPESGRFAERVDRLTHEDGELAGVMRRQVSGDGSELGRTLSAHLGPGSPLLTLVDPESRDGLASAFTKLVNKELEGQRSRILSEFSLDNREGSLSRLLTELRENHGKLTNDLGERIDEVVREFSLDDESSALSRLVQRVERAQRQITDEFSLDSESSALARMRRELMEVAQQQSEKISSMEKTVATELAALTARRAEAERTTTHGDEFEDAVARELEIGLAGGGDVFERTGTRVGLIRNCKKGDAVIELGPEQQAAGARIVVEAKDDRSFTMARARQELETARKNRGAELGIFVFSQSTAPESLAPLERVGQDVFVRWDRDDPSTDGYLAAALSVCRALCMRAREHSRDDVDLDAIERAIRDIEKQAAGLDEIKRSVQTIESSSERIVNRVRLMGKNLARGVETLDAGAATVRRALAD
jgi:hypothetical protein